MLVDAHAHLDDPRLAPNLAEVLERARAAGVEKIITVGTGPESSRAAISVAERHRGVVYAAVGIHPHEADRATPEVRRQIEEATQSPHVVGIGETGLDYHYNYSSASGQKELFRWHIELALRMRLPLVVHCREAYADCLDILRAPSSRGLVGVAHCFSGGWEEAEGFLALGFHLSFAGTLTFPNAAALRTVAQRAPLDRLLVETDCPYLSPEGKRGQTNEPAFVALTASFLDQLRVSDGTMASEAAARNAVRLFRLWS